MLGHDALPLTPHDELHEGITDDLGLGAADQVGRRDEVLVQFGG